MITLQSRIKHSKHLQVGYVCCALFIQPTSRSLEILIKETHTHTLFCLMFYNTNLPGEICRVKESLKQINVRE